VLLPVGEDGHRSRRCRERIVVAHVAGGGNGHGVGDGEMSSPSRKPVWLMGQNIAVVQLTVLWHTAQFRCRQMRTCRRVAPGYSSAAKVVQMAPRSRIGLAVVARCNCMMWQEVCKARWHAHWQRKPGVLWSNARQPTHCVMAPEQFRHDKSRPADGGSDSCGCCHVVKGTRVPAILARDRQV